MILSPRDRVITKVNLEMTTVCNLACPECSAGINMGLRKPVHHPWEYFVEAARWLRGIESLVVIGGEPTCHPQFAEFIPKFRDLFEPGEMVLWTNGFKAQEYAETLKLFDAVYASLYDETNATWNKRPNTGAVQFIKLNYNHATMELAHTSRSRRGSGAICERGIHGPVTYADGRLYPCCVSMGLPEGIGMEPCVDWRTKILDVPMPCHACMFSPGEAVAA